ncbi:MAG TPA: DUF1700 domain-containing protein [Spirochaetia bacterium]|nr:DUF1700 domain-containing protein [Spirochaetia bacterium]
MNKEQYLRELYDSLDGLTEQDKREIASDYEEHFRAGIAEGKGEEEIARSLGNPRSIGKSYRIDSMIGEGSSATAVGVLRAVFATLSLGFFNIVIVLGPFIAVVAVVVSLWAVAASIGLSGVGIVFGVIARPIFPAYLSTGGFHPAFLIFAGIGLAALGVLAVIGMWQLSKWVVRVVGKYVQLNVRIVSNRR